jgi:S-DNA-T family DNA segregation ATPase FtsK/SpoIIIE
MPYSTSTARSAEYLPRPQLAIARRRPRHINLLTLAAELNGDTQLHDALTVPGTALLGVAPDGVPLMLRLASPDVANVLISGNKGSGKTELIRTMLASIALYQKPRDIQFLVMDPVARGFEFLNQTPHLLGEIAATTELALRHLRWLENELERRENENLARPRLVVAIDDIAELIPQGGRELQVHLTRLAQRGRRAGISIILCTRQANTAEVNTSLRANFPLRITGKNSSATDGASALAGRGDFILTAGGERVRFQAAHLAPGDINAFQTRVYQQQTRSASPKSGLGGLVRRLRRIK